MAGWMLRVEWFVDVGDGAACLEHLAGPAGAGPRQPCDEQWSAGHPQAGASLPAMRSADGQRTSYARCSFSNVQMTRAEESSWPLSTPWRAAVGSAWCRLCQDSPIDGIASHATLPDLSRALNGR